MGTPAACGGPRGVGRRERERETVSLLVILTSPCDSDSALFMYQPFSLTKRSIDFEIFELFLPAFAKSPPWPASEMESYTVMKKKITPPLFASFLLPVHIELRLF